MALHAKWNPPNANGEAGRIARAAWQKESLNFGSASEENIREGIKRLGAVLPTLI